MHCPTLQPPNPKPQTPNPKPRTSNGDLSADYEGGGRSCNKTARNLDTCNKTTRNVDTCNVDTRSKIARNKTTECADAAGNLKLGRTAGTTGSRGLTILPTLPTLPYNTLYNPTLPILPDEPHQTRPGHPRSFECSCNAGYQGDGRACAPKVSTVTSS